MNPVIKISKNAKEKAVLEETLIFAKKIASFFSQNYKTVKVMSVVFKNY